MFPRSFVSILLLPAAWCAQAATLAPTAVGTLPPAARPAGVPPDYVVTPNGLFHPSCVVGLAEGDTLSAAGDVLHADGSVAPAAACAWPRYDARGRLVPSAGALSPQADFNGWIAASDSDFDVTPPAGRMVGDFTVPSGPTSQAGQVLYFFPGLEDGQAVITILQPVLAWNGFGDSRWTMTNWNCCKNGSTFHGGTIPVSTGDAIHGSMKGSQCRGDVCTQWKLVSQDKSTGGQTTFNTQSFGQAFTWYFGGVLEAYGVSQCSHFPSNGRIDFVKDKVFDLQGVQSTPSAWSQFVSGGAPACRFTVTTPSAHKTTLTWNTSP